MRQGAVSGCEMEMERRRCVVGRGSVGYDQKVASARIAGGARTAVGSSGFAKATDIANRFGEMERRQIAWGTMQKDRNMVGVGTCIELGAEAKGRDEDGEEKESCSNDAHGEDECNAIAEFIS